MRMLSAAVRMNLCVLSHLTLCFVSVVCVLSHLTLCIVPLTLCFVPLLGKSIRKESIRKINPLRKTVSKPAFAFGGQVAPTLALDGTSAAGHCGKEVRAMVMLNNKKYYFMVEPTKACQMSFPARWVYSFLLFRTSVNKPAVEDCICRNLGLCNRAVKNYLSELREAKLLAEANDRYLASEPSEECRQWFVQKSNGESLPWFQRFASYAVYVPAPHQGIPISHSALLSLLWSLRHGSGWRKIKTAGLATMLFPELQRPSAKRQVNRAAKNLRDKGLLDERWEVTIQKEHHHYWRDADHLANPRSRSDVGFFSLREYVLDNLGNYHCQFYFENLYAMGKHLDRYERLMKQAGYNQRQILDYWEDVIYEPVLCNRKCDLVEVFIAKGFLSIFETAEDQTKENRITKGYVGISLGFLCQLTQHELLAIRDLAGRNNSNGESLLRLYEPSNERQRTYGRMTV